MLLILLCIAPLAPAAPAPAPSSPAWLIPVTELVVPLIDDRPSLWDAQRFPCAEACRNAMKANREYLAWLYARADFFPDQRDAYLRLIAETERRYCIWDWALAVAGGCQGWSVEASLVGLCQRLTAEEYTAGRLPAALPVEWWE